MLRVRTAAEADLPSVLSLLEEAELHIEGVPELLGRTGWLGVAQTQDRVVGAIGLEVHEHQGLLRSVVVAPDQRGTGLGRELVAEAVQRARQAGLSEIVLLTLTAPDFFSHLGFTLATGTVAGPVTGALEFTTLCPSNAQTFRLALGSEVPGA